MVSLGALAAGQLTRRCGFAVFFLRVGVRHGSHHARVRERTLPRVLLLPRTGDMSLVGGVPPSVGGADAAGAGDEPVGDAGSDAGVFNHAFLGWSLLASSVVHFLGGLSWLGASGGSLFCGMHFVCRECGC